MTNRQTIIDAIKELPGIGSGDVAKLTGISPGSVSAHMSQLATEGILRREPEGKGYAYFVRTVNVEEAAPTSEPVTEIKRIRTKSVRMTIGRKLELAQQALEAALEHVKNLEAWQAAAIKKYPDLAVSQALLAARQVAIDYYSKVNDPEMVKSIRQGKMDQTPLIQVALLAMAP